MKYACDLIKKIANPEKTPSFWELPEQSHGFVVGNMMNDKISAPNPAPFKGKSSCPTIVSVDRAVDAEALMVVRECGFDHVLINYDAPVGLIPAESGEGGTIRSLSKLVRLRVDQFDKADPLVENFSDRFTVPGELTGDGVIDPRASSSVGQHAVLNTQEDLPREIFITIRHFLIEHLDRGVAGFVFDGLSAKSQPFYSRLLESLREDFPQAILVGATPGLPRDDALTLAKAGFDYLLSSLSWWDMRARWLVEEHADISPHTPLLSQITPSRAATAADPVQARGLLLAAAFTGSGVVAPIDLVLRCADGAEIAMNIARSAAAGGALQVLSSVGSPVTGILRLSDSQAAGGTSGTILLVNNTRDIEPLPTQLRVGHGWQSFDNLTGSGDSLAPLAPGEIRVIAGTFTTPVSAKIRSGKKSARSAAEKPRIVIENISPSVAGGDFAVKRVVGETVAVTADVYTDGHEKVAVRLLWRAETDKHWQAADMDEEGNDVWSASFPLDRLGRHLFSVEAWDDRFGYYRESLIKKVASGVAQPVDFMEGRGLIAAVQDESAASQAALLDEHLAAYDKAEDEAERASLLTSPDLAGLMVHSSERPHHTLAEPQTIDAERIAARFSSWYELFPRSMTPDKRRHGNLRDVIDHLPRVAGMGFDTLYFPPIHPIGETNRKGPDNTLTPGENDPGSPYAIGSEAGGHDAIHPELGTFEDLRALVAAAKGHRLEIALDFAIQCSPDHPWLKEHPGWFAWRPDGSMKYAENPPKKYQDIVNVDFYGPDAVPDLWTELRDIVLLWVKEGIKTFRVDNPHTKPLNFWEWMIREVRSAHPDVIFLSEAFTRPKLMYRLAKAGFTQGYTYFTWRNTKTELTEYIEELTTEEPREFFRPHFFVNTPDINPVFLQTGGRPAHRIRAVLAATLSGLWGVYSGFELCDAAPLPGREEYASSEKFEIRPREWRSPGDIVEDITLLNRLRRGHPALQTHLNTRFYPAYNDNIIYYGKPSSDGGDMILIAVNMDPHGEHGCDFEVPLWDLDLPDDGTVAVEDLVSGGRFTWSGKIQHLHLTPEQPYRIWRIEPLGGAYG